MLYFIQALPKLAVRTCVGTKVGVCSDVFLEHRGLLTSDATLLAHIFSSAPTSDVCVFVRVSLHASQRRSTARCLRIFFLNARDCLNLVVWWRHGCCNLRRLRFHQSNNVSLRLGNRKLSLSLPRVIEAHRGVRRQIENVGIVAVVDLPVAVHRKLVLVLNVNRLRLVHSAIKCLRARFQAQIRVSVTIQIHLNARLWWTWRFRRNQWQSVGSWCDAVMLFGSEGSGLQWESGRSQKCQLWRFGLLLRFFLRLPRKLIHLLINSVWIDVVSDARKIERFLLRENSIWPWHYLWWIPWRQKHAVLFHGGWIESFVFEGWRRRRKIVFVESAHWIWTGHAGHVGNHSTAMHNRLCPQGWRWHGRHEWQRQRVVSSRRWKLEVIQWLSTRIHWIRCQRWC